MANISLLEDRSMIYQIQNLPPPDLGMDDIEVEHVEIIDNILKEFTLSFLKISALFHCV